VEEEEEKFFFFGIPETLRVCVLCSVGDSA